MTGGSLRDDEQPDDGQADQAAGAADEEESGEQQTAALGGVQPEELIGREVENTRGDTVAEIGDLVRQRSDGALFAVLDVGGFLGIGGKEVAIPLDDFQQVGSDTLVLPEATESELESMPPYNHAQYEPVAE